MEPKPANRGRFGSAYGTTAVLKPVKISDIGHSGHWLLLCVEHMGGQVVVVADVASRAP